MSPYITDGLAWMVRLPVLGRWAMGALETRHGRVMSVGVMQIEPLTTEVGFLDGTTVTVVGRLGHEYAARSFNAPSSPREDG